MLSILKECSEVVRLLKPRKVRFLLNGEYRYGTIVGFANQGTTKAIIKADEVYLVELYDYKYV